MTEEKATPTPPPMPTRRGPGRVHIYGAGITGLTAAHELALRGFRVRVYEPAMEYDEKGKLEGRLFMITQRILTVGGMARTQFVRVAKGALGNFPGQGQFTTCDQYRLLHPIPQGFTGWQDNIDPERKLYDFVYNCGYFRDRSPGILHIRMPHPSKPEDFNDPRFSRRASAAYAAREYLSRAVTSDETPSPYLATDRVIFVNWGEWQQAKQMETPFPPMEDKDELLLEVLHYLPGEHGFRFFPSYYRHLFSTMVETPILDAQGQVTGRRVYDNLEPSSFYGIAAQGRRIRFLRRAPATRPVEMLQELEDLASTGYPASDTLQFSLRIWRYLCTCSERRKAEYERISWWEYLEGFDPDSGTRRYQYSDAFKRDMQFAPRVLAAFDGAWGDARTNGNTLAQLYLNNLMPLPKTDGTLNGPTTLAWFRPWRRYLEEYLGVDFQPLGLKKIVLDKDGRLVPYVVHGLGETADLEGGGESGLPEPVDYYIVATDVETAEEVTLELPELGVVKGLRGYSKVVPPNPRGPEPARKRDKDVLPGQVPWDRFQTLTGIQFFFPSTVRLAEGYLYFLDAPWGLSAINSHQYWATPPTSSEHGFASVLSVDIGNWYVREPGQLSPSTSSRQQIAQEVWRQIRKATEQHNAPLPHARQFEFTLPDPAWYHIDRHLQFTTDPKTRTERATRNRAPYLIPIMGDWDNRPGADPWDPLAPPAEAKPRKRLPKGLWQAPHGGYQVHWGKLVFAGTYLKTFTRMTTMESANESARHAVNAIIDHYLAHKKPEEPRQRGGPRSGTASVTSGYGSQGSLTGSPDFRMTPIGEYCRIWDPEKHELAELAPLRELDAQLFAAGLPHVWDVLQLEPLALPLLSALGSTPGAETLRSFVDKVRAFLKAMPWPSWPGTPGSTP